MTSQPSSHGARCPVWHQTGETGHWAFKGHADVVRAAEDPETFSSAVSRHLQIPNALDGAEHAKWRGFIEQWFTPDRMSHLQPELQGVAQDAVQRLTPGNEVDAVTGIGASFAVTSTCLWLGWPLDLREELLAWVARNQDATRAGDYARTTEVAEEFDAIIRRLTSVRREAGDAAPDDVTAELVRATIDGRPLEDEEIVSILRNWTAGDLASIALCVGVLLRTLADRPDIQEEVRRRVDDDEALDRAIDEILRIDDPFVSNRRVTTRRVTVSGVTLEPDQRVVLRWVDANRDPAEFPDADAFEPEAHAERNLVYGTGPHACPGRPLATLELRTLLREVLRTTSWIDPGQTRVRQEPPFGGWDVATVVARA